MAIKFAERMSHLGTESAFEVLAKARRLEAEGKRIVHLEIGEPDFATPDNIVEAGISAMQNGYTHYTPAAGIFEARQAVAGFVTRMLKTEVDPAEVVLVPGSKNVLLFTLLNRDEMMKICPALPGAFLDGELLGHQTAPAATHRDRHQLRKLVRDAKRPIPYSPAVAIFILTKKDCFRSHCGIGQ